MDALILSCGTGGGHNSAGIAIKEELLKRGQNVTMLNPYNLRSRKLARTVDRTYIKIAQRAPKAFGAVYKAGNLYRKLPWRSPVYFVNGHMMNILENFLREHPVDVIIMPHLFPAEILTYMRNKGIEIPKTIFVATDYTCIPFTEECQCDACVIPSEKLTEEFVGRGISKESIYPLGIPVKDSFVKSLTKDEAKTELNLDANKKYILVSGGSIGAGYMKKTLEILYDLTKDSCFELIVICGNNSKLYDELEKKYSGKIILIGQTNQMALYLQASEMFFTKPGGLSTTEAAVMEVPLGLLPPIPGCESRNFQFYIQNGMAVEVNLSSQALAAVIKNLESSSFCEKMAQCQRDTIKKDAAKQICDLAFDLINEK